MNRSFSFILTIFLFPFIHLSAQHVKVVNEPKAKRIDVFIDDRPFTSFCYSDTIAKPFLFPVYAPSGAVVTRGYPIAPRPGERMDHPHQIGLWFNYGDVNGIDFWGNSFAIKAEEKNKKGHIVVREIVKTESGTQGSFEIISDWKDIKGKTLLTENTIYIFSGEKDLWTIDHIATLNASSGPVTFNDTKEGMFAIRVDRAFEMPSGETLKLTGAKENSDEAKAQYNEGLTGMYHASNGKSGDAVWGTRNSWMTLSGKTKNVPVCMAIFDNPKNPGFPAYYHARGYGLFSVNNLGRKSYDPQQEESVLKLARGESLKLIHRFCVQSGSEITAGEAEDIFKSFSNQYK